jgi:hypothetical protein
VQAGADAQKIAVDAAVDVTVSGGTVWLSMGAGAAAGSIFPVIGTVGGALVGIIVGTAINFSTDVLLIDGKSAMDWIKEETYVAVDGMEENALAEMRLLTYY